MVSAVVVVFAEVAVGGAPHDVAGAVAMALRSAWEKRARRVRIREGLVPGGTGRRFYDGAATGSRRISSIEDGARSQTECVCLKTEE